MSDRLLSVREACERLGVSRSTIYKALLTGEGPPIVKMGKRTLFRESSLESWIARQEAGYQAQQERV